MEETIEEKEEYGDLKEYKQPKYDETARFGVIKKYGFLPSSVWNLRVADSRLNDIIKDNDPSVRTTQRMFNQTKELPDQMHIITQRKISQSYFNPVVAERIVKFYTEKGENILDPFMGRATRMITALALGRNYVGFDVSPKSINFNHKRLDEVQKEQMAKFETKATLFLSDGTKLAPEGIPLAEESFDLIFTCPPYWDLEKYESVNGQLSDCLSYEEFMIKIEKSVQRCREVLKKGRHCIWVVNDFRKEGHYYNFHGDLISLFLKNRWNLHDIVINVLISPYMHLGAERNDELKYMAKQHEYILVFKK